ncbi:hypothetical protein JCM21900_005978 [Sporobolomyces salmonicolor]
MQQQDPSAVNARGAPSYMGTTHHPDVRFAPDGVPKIGPSPPPPERPASFKLAVDKAKFSNGAVLEHTQTSGGRLELDVRPERVVLLHFESAASGRGQSAPPKRIFAGPAKKLRGIMIEIDRWPGRFGCIMRLVFVFPDFTAVVLTIDTRASSGFKPQDVEQIKNRCRVWSLRYKVHISIPNIYTSAVPPFGSFLPPPPPPGYNSADSSTWLEPFPPVSEVKENYAAAEEAKKQAVVKPSRAEEYLTTETNDEDMPAPKRARQTTIAVNENTQEQVLASASAMALRDGVMDLNRPIYSITGREQRRSTLKTASYADPWENRGSSERGVDEDSCSASPIPGSKPAPLRPKSQPRHSARPKPGGSAASAPPKKHPTASSHHSASPELFAHPQPQPSPSTPAASPPTVLALQRMVESVQAGFSGLSTRLEALTSAVSSLPPRAPALPRSAPPAHAHEERPRVAPDSGGARPAREDVQVAHAGLAVVAPEPGPEPRGCCCCCAATERTAATLAADGVGRLEAERERDRMRIKELEQARTADQTRITELEARVEEGWRTRLDELEARLCERWGAGGAAAQEQEQEQEQEQQGRDRPT